MITATLEEKLFIDLILSVAPCQADPVGKISNMLPLSQYIKQQGCFIMFFYKPYSSTYLAAVDEACYNSQLSSRSEMIKPEL